MMKKILYIIAAGAMLLASCSKENNANNEPVAVRFTLSITTSDDVPAVRAAGAAWASGDAIGIFMVDKGTANIAEGATNKQHTTTGGSSFAPVSGDEIYYPVDETKKVDFIAYYPYKAAQVLGNYDVNVATQTSQPAIDLLWSKATNTGSGFSKASGNVALVFDRKLSKVIIETTAGDGLTATDLVGMTVTIAGMNTKATFDLKGGVLGTSTTPANIVPVTTTDGVEYEAIVLPADFAVDALVITFKIGNEVFTWKNPTTADGKLEAGKQYTYTMTITRTGVSFTCTINDWDSVPRTGTAE